MVRVVVDEGVVAMGTNNVQVRAEILPIVSLGIYAHLSDARRARELDQAPRLRKQYALLQKKLAKMSPEEKKVGTWGQCARAAVLNGLDLREVGAHHVGSGRQKGHDT
jgi:hypothetical protein